MNNVNKTLYIPLFGKAYVSKKGLFLSDTKAEEIWETAKFPLKGKSKSKWLAYYMGIRAAVFDEWLKDKIAKNENAVIIHIGCGLDSRNLRVGAKGCKWYDIDFFDVIKERKRYYNEDINYKMIAGDARDCEWLSNINENSNAIVVMEGVSMYLTNEELKKLTENLSSRFSKLSLLVDCYSLFAAKMSKRKNPINDVSVTKVYGLDNPLILQNENFSFVAERAMTPEKYINELKNFEKFVFSKLYAGGISKKLYRLFEYEKS